MATARFNEASAGSLRSDSIEELFGALESPLLDYALRLVRNPAVAEEIVHDAFTKLHAQFEEIHEPHRWLYRTVHCLALKYQRNAEKVVPFGRDGTQSSTPAKPNHSERDTNPIPDEQIAFWAGIGLVRSNLQNLDERSRELIRMKFNDALSYQEISARTGLKVGLVGQLLHHALKGMATELARTGVNT